MTNISNTLNTLNNTSNISHQFIEFAITQNVLRFGEFTTKAGRLSPYFFNAGLFNTGFGAARLAQFYAQAIVEQNIEFDVIFGPAYKGIPLAATIAAALYQNHGINKGFAYNRKEVKDHGEGGVLVGHPLTGRILIVDDVISAGTSIKQSIELIQTQAGATVAGVLIALDRMEKAGTAEHIEPLSAALQLKELGLDVHAIANLQDLLSYVANNNGNNDNNQLSPELLAKIAAYHQRYGI